MLTLAYMQWVELEEASLVWINMPWKQLAEDFGLPDKSTTINRTEKQANIAVSVSGLTGGAHSVVGCRAI